MLALEAVKRLKDGNARFIRGESILKNDQPINEQLKAVIHGQRPFAVILGCSDSRVPAEIVFDQGLGDLFVIRVAGNIVAPSQIGSVEFSVEKFDTQLVVVLGHTFCGAIEATIDALNNPESKNSRNIESIVNRITPWVKTLWETPLKQDIDALMQHAVRANVRASVNQLSHGSEALERKINHGELKIIGAEYCLITGKVTFLDEDFSEFSD